LRPLGYGDILDEVFDLYKKHFVLFAGIAGVFFLPIYAIGYALGPVGETLAGILTWFGQNAVLAAITWAVSRVYLGETVSIGQAYKAIARRFVMFFLTMLVVGIIIGIGAMLCLVPGIIFAFWYAFVSQVFILEGKGGAVARNRSKDLAAGNWIRILIIYLVTFLLALIITLAFTLPFEMRQPIDAATRAAQSPGVLYGIAQGLALTLTSPISVIAFVLLYYDIRVRKEGFDIEMLAQNMGQSTPAPDTAPAA
jgi:hypothetical protein